MPVFLEMILHKLRMWLLPVEIFINNQTKDFYRFNPWNDSAIKQNLSV